MKAEDEQDKGGGVQVISRAATILNILGEHPEGLSLGKIAQSAQLPRSTVQRLVGALESVELIRSNGKAGVTLGPAFLKLVTNAHTDVITAMRPRLEALSELTGETVALSRPAGETSLLFTVLLPQENCKSSPGLVLRALFTAPLPAAYCFLCNVMKTSGRFLQKSSDPPPTFQFRPSPH